MCRFECQCKIKTLKFHVVAEKKEEKKRRKKKHKHKHTQNDKFYFESLPKPNYLNIEHGASWGFFLKEKLTPLQ